MLSDEASNSLPAVGKQTNDGWRPPESSDDRIRRLVTKSARIPLPDDERQDLTEALCYTERWNEAADAYGVSGLFRSDPTELFPSRHPDENAYAAQAFASLVIKNPQVADWFFVFCPVPKGTSMFRDSLRGASTVRQFIMGFDEIATGSPARIAPFRDRTGTRADDTCQGSPEAERDTVNIQFRQSLDDAAFVLVAATCSGIIASERARALLTFAGLSYTTPTP